MSGEELEPSAVTAHDPVPCYALCAENITGLAREHCRVCGDRLTYAADGSPAHRPDVAGGAGPIEHPATVEPR